MIQLQKEDANKKLKDYENEKIYIAINGALNTIRLSKSPQINSTEFLYNKNPKQYNKDDIRNLIKAFNVNTIFFEQENFCYAKDVIINLKLSYDEELKAIDFPFAKKLIFLTRVTKSEAFLYLVKKQKYIVLACVSENEFLNIDIFKDETINRLPIFTNSNEIRAYALKHPENTKKYKPLMMKFKDIQKIAEKDKNGIIINPQSTEIKGRNFRLDISPELLNYIKKISL